MKRFDVIALGSLLLCAGLVTATTRAASDWVSLPGQTPVYNTGSSEPACCYSADRIWRKTNNESRWSIRGRHFSPYGFANREGYRPSRPTPLPRGVESSNPWAGGEYVQRIGNGRQAGRGNAEFFRPAYFNYPPPVGPVPGGVAGDPLDPLLMLPIPAPGLLADPYLGGLYLPGLAGPVGPWGAPGMVPGMWPGWW